MAFATSGRAQRGSIAFCSSPKLGFSLCVCRKRPIHDWRGRRCRPRALFESQPLWHAIEPIYNYDASSYSYDAVACMYDSRCPNTRFVHKFTGKERDSESGLDDFGARYFASTMGRFMSPDLLGGHQEDPQTLNKYVYARNNPLNLTDPTGLDFNLTCSGEDTATCHGGLQGTTTTTTDANGNQTSTFTATVISNDKNGDPVDQNVTRHP
jgi:RHS repeat-associated protein